MSENTTAPEIAGETSQDQNIIGTMTPEESSALANIRQKLQNMTMEVGKLEVHKSRLLGSMAELEMQAQGVLDAMTTRLGFPAEPVPYQILPDGRVRLVPQNPTDKVG